MSDLNFQIQTKNGVIPVPKFQKAVNNAIYLLNQFDVGISQRSRGVLDWYVDELHSNGNGNENGNGNGHRKLSIHFISKPKRIKKPIQSPVDIAPLVTEEFLEGVGGIESQAVTPRYLSEVAIDRVGQLADLLDEGTEKFTFSTKERSIEVTPKTSENVRKIVTKNRTAYGTIEGRLEGLNIHNQYFVKGLLYHQITKKVVTCLFDRSQLNRVRRAFGKLVSISGELHKNVNGDTIRIVSPELEVLEGKRRFSFSKQGLAIPEFADTRSTAEYMRRIRGG